MKRKRINIKKIMKWVLQIIGYSFILMCACIIFKKSIYIDNSCFGVWCLLASVLIYLLNKTVKPLLFWLTLPITGLTLGLFYPCINVIILYFVAFVMGNHFNLPGNILVVFLIAVFISIMKFILTQIIDWLFRKEN
jgi:putative membrane protein